MADRGRGRGDRGRGRGERGRGRGEFSGRGRGSFDGGRGGYEGGRGGFEGGRGSYDGGRGRGSFDRGRGSFDRGRGDRGRGRGGSFGGTSRDEGPEIFTPAAGAPTTPDPVVQKTEDAILAAGIDISSLSLKENYPRRPAFGTLGKQILLRANYFEAVPDANMTLFRHHVEFKPSATGGKLAQLLRLLLKQTPFVGLGNAIASDNASTIITRKKIINTDQKFDIVYMREGEEEPPQNPSTYVARVQFSGTIAVSELMQFLKNPVSNPGKEEALQALNIVMARYPASQSSTMMVGKNKFYSLGNDKETKFLGGGLEALRGFFTSVRTATCRLLVNVNVSHCVTFQSQKLTKLIEEYENAYPRYDVPLGRFLRLVKVRPTHLPERKNKKTGKPVPRVKTIIDVAHPSDGRTLPHPPRVERTGANARQVQFWLEEGDKPGRYVTVFDFFRRHLQSNLPVVNVGNAANPMYLPPDVCDVIPGQTYNKELLPSHTSEMIRFACRRPPANAISITGKGATIVGLNADANESPKLFGLSIKPEMIVVPGRVLESPNVKYKNDRGGGDKYAPTSAGSWNMRGIAFSSGASIGGWNWVFFSSRRAEADEVTADIQKFSRAMGNMGIDTRGQAPMNAGQVKQLNIANIDSFFQLAANVTPKPKLLLVILSERHIQAYNRIKYNGDIKYGIHTVCMIKDKFLKERGQDQYFANVALKWNLKRGGMNQLIDPPKLGIIAEGKTMIVGLDVTHPAPGSLAPSISGIVASTDRFAVQFPAEIRVQESRKEMITFIKDMFKARLLLWRQKNKELPRNVLVYRDGVSEGQYSIVLNDEVSQIRSAFEELYPASDTKAGIPKLSVIVVGKRHHTRFYPMKDAEKDRACNPMNGTVVDRGVTEAWNWDFYLQAHTGLQGTARPAHYYVILDEIFSNRRSSGGAKGPGNAADDLEQLTHNLCYMYGRATKAVSICPPAYYADLVCERARCYLGQVQGSLGGSDKDSERSSERGAKGKKDQGPLPSAEHFRLHDDMKEIMKPTTVSLEALRNGNVPFSVLEDAFGPTSLGIILVHHLPSRYAELRQKLLTYASTVGNLPPQELQKLESPESRYLAGWSCGKEKLSNGRFDTLKGSYYINTAFYKDKSLAAAPVKDGHAIPEYTVPTPFPPTDHPTLADFKATAEELIALIIDVAILVARACDTYAAAKVPAYEPGYLERAVSLSVSGKARLLHYYPPPESPDADLDDWCGVHVDHGCLTGLTSALYLDEDRAASVADQGTNLYILPRTSLRAFKNGEKSDQVPVAIPEDALAFQTGAALEAVTRGAFKAVPHFVTAPKASQGKHISRNTLAVFTQPNLEEVVDPVTGETFGQFAQRIVAGNY